MENNNQQQKRIDYRATFKKCPDCNGTDFSEQYPKCLHCSDCAWAACMYTDPELEGIAHAIGIDICYTPSNKI